MFAPDFSDYFENRMREKIEASMDRPTGTMRAAELRHRYDPFQSHGGAT
jgi:hypothetical protein